jgi:hypothetical protein
MRLSQREKARNSGHDEGRLSAVQLADAFAAMQEWRDAIARAHAQAAVRLAYARAAATLALHDAVALFNEALAFAILALRPLLDVGAFVVGHGMLRAIK